MTLEDLRISMNNFMPTWVEIVTDNDGQVVINTNMIVGDNGELEEME